MTTHLLVLLACNNAGDSADPGPQPLGVEDAVLSFEHEDWDYFYPGRPSISVLGDIDQDGKDDVGWEEPLPVWQWHKLDLVSHFGVEGLSVSDLVVQSWTPSQEVCSREYDAAYLIPGHPVLEETRPPVSVHYCLGTAIYQDFGPGAQETVLLNFEDAGPGDHHPGVEYTTDLSGDGLADLVVVAPTYIDNSGYLLDKRAAMFFLEGPVSGTIPIRELNPVFLNVQGSYVLGEPLQPAGDLDGDGYPELLYNSNNYDVFVLDRWIDPGTYDYNVFSGALSIFPTPENLEGIVPLGDMDQDGSDDLLIAGFNEISGESVVTLFYGPIEGHQTQDDADARITGVPLQLMGHSNAALGDVSGDGFGDIAVGTRWEGRHFNNVESQVLVYYGPLLGDYRPNDADIEILGSRPGDWFGFWVGAGDLDGDDKAELLVSQKLFDQILVFDLW